LTFRVTCFFRIESVHVTCIPPALNYSPGKGRYLLLFGLLVFVLALDVVAPLGGLYQLLASIITFFERLGLLCLRSIAGAAHR